MSGNVGDYYTSEFQESSRNRTSVMMAQQVSTLATKPDDPSSVPGTHRQKERTSSYELSSTLHPSHYLQQPRSQTHT